MLSMYTYVPETGTTVFFTQSKSFTPKVSMIKALSTDQMRLTRIPNITVLYICSNCLPVIAGACKKSLQECQWIAPAYEGKLTFPDAMIVEIL